MINPRVPTEAAPAERLYPLTYQAPRAPATRPPATPQSIPPSSPRGPATPATRPRATSSPRRPAEESEAGAGPSGLQAPVTPEERIRMQKRKRSIQRSIDLQILQEAETEAQLEESVMEEEIVSRES